MGKRKVELNAQDRGDLMSGRRWREYLELEEKQDAFAEEVADCLDFPDEYGDGTRAPMWVERHPVTATSSLLILALLFVAMTAVAVVASNEVDNSRRMVSEAMDAVTGQQREMCNLINAVNATESNLEIEVPSICQLYPYRPVQVRPVDGGPL